MAFSETGSSFIGNLSECEKSPSKLLYSQKCRILCPQGRTRRAFNRERQNPSNRFLCIPTNVRRYHVRNLLVFYISTINLPIPSPMLAIGGFAERAHLGPLLFFVFVWSTLVYDPIACWTWNSNGWSFTHGALDFAGGTPVHISSGTAALAISIYLGKRRGYGTEALAYKPHNTTYVILGTLFLWFGWFGKYN